MNTELLDDVGFDKDRINKVIKELAIMKTKFFKLTPPDYDKATTLAEAIQLMNYAYNGFLVPKINKDYENKSN